jgi:hypothetical protein
LKGGAGGKSTLVAGLSHFDTVDQLFGIPIFSLPAPEDKNFLKN